MSTPPSKKVISVLAQAAHISAYGGSGIAFALIALGTPRRTKTKYRITPEGQRQKKLWGR